MLSRKSLRNLFPPVLIIMMLASCAGVPEVKKEAGQQPTISENELPLTVAILPFVNDTKEVGLASQLRRAFANNFSAKNYVDMKLPLVDERVVQLEKSTGKTITDLKPQEVCAALGCDGLIYGRIMDYTKVNVGLYSQIGAEAEVWMVNTRTGKEVARVKDNVRYHEGGVPLSPIGAIITAFSTAMNIREIQQVRMVNELGFKLAGKMPSPSRLAAENRPVIKEVLTNAKDGPFGKGKIIKVGMEGEPGLIATFDIGSFRKGIPMKETKAGIYVGEYLVLPGDNAADMPIIASLTRLGGYESEWVDVSGFVTIDTTPPPQVKGLRARGFIDRIEISWDALKDVPDLKTYKVLRSEQPLSGYTELSLTEQSSLDDKTAKAGTVYYYRVTAVDYAGNESELQDAVPASLASKEPVVLSGEMQKDSVLSGIYVVKGSFLVPRGLHLAIAPETTIMFDEGSSLIVRGQLNSDGRGQPVEFIPSGDKRWKGLIIENGSVMLSNFHLKNAETAIQITNSKGKIENGIIADSGTAVSISGTPAVALRGNTISGNMIGIELQMTDAVIAKNNIFQNKEGIAAKGFSGDIADNNIYDNEENISSSADIRVAANYLGSVNTDEMKTNGVIVTKTYDEKVPDGKVVSAISNPYAALSMEDRQKKAIEFVIEAGNYFRQSNYGKASTLFEEALKAFPTAEVYYYLALSYKNMKEDDKAMRFLKEGTGKFPQDSTLFKNLGLMYYEKGDETEARKAFEEVLRLSPEDKQARFLLERLGK